MPAREIALILTAAALAFGLSGAWFLIERLIAPCPAEKDIGQRLSDIHLRQGFGVRSRASWFVAVERDGQGGRHGGTQPADWT